MKKFLTLIILLSCAFIAFAQNAVIKDLTGTVEIQRAGSSQWANARAGDAIQRNTVISTGFKSTAVLTVGSSTILVRPVTRLTLQELVTLNDSETVNLNLNSGRVRVDVNPPAGKKTSFSVQSPASTASVRGTSFEMDPFSLYVTEGEVSYTPLSGSRAVTVGAGQRSRIIAGGSALTPMAAAEEISALPALPGQSRGRASARVRTTAQKEDGLYIEIEILLPDNLN